MVLFYSALLCEEITQPGDVVVMFVETHQRSQTKEIGSILISCQCSICSITVPSDASAISMPPMILKKRRGWYDLS